MKKRLFLIPLCIFLLTSCGRATFDGGETLDADGVAKMQAELAAENAAAEEAARVTPETPCYFIAGSEVYHLDRDCAYIKDRAEVQSATVGWAEATGDMHACPPKSEGRIPRSTFFPT